jgi:hypothetical protein
MKRILTLLALAAALVGAGCREAAPPPHAVMASGAPGGQTYCVWQSQASIPAVTGNNATITLFDSTIGGTARGVYDFLQRIMVTANFDQTVTVNYDIQLGTSTQWVRAAGTNASSTFTGGTTTTGTNEIDFLVQGNESRVQMVTGGTGPGVAWNKPAIRLCYVRDLGQ